uniref:Uncharacterized protein n=1 Tax=Anguilla anguilla TaxID=7936 RepID=A0A0E9Q4E3_ANGAN
MCGSVTSPGLLLFICIVGVLWGKKHKSLMLEALCNASLKTAPRG